MATDNYEVSSATFFNSPAMNRQKAFSKTKQQPAPHARYRGSFRL